METLAERITYIRNGLGLTQEQFVDALNEVLKEAGEAPITRGAISNWEAGTKGIARRNIRALSELSGATFEWIDSNRGQMPREDLLRRIGERFLGARPAAAGGYPLTIEVVAQAAGSTLGKGAPILFDLPAIGYLPLLPGLVGLQGVYGLEVTGDSMIPMFRPGRAVYVSPTSPVHKDDPIIVIEHHSKNGEAVGFIKLMVADKKDRIVARQLNPPAQIEYMKAPGLTVHRVLDLSEAIGYSGIESIASDAWRATPTRRK
jgi:phage repressor protein C with HTH and peptisase S24 domain